MKIIDISYSFSNDMVKYPSLLPYEKKWIRHYDKGDENAVSYFQTPSHNGTHLDAPFHYCKTGIMMEDVPLEVFVGRVLVIEVPEDKNSIGMESVINIGDFPERVLFKTRNSLYGYGELGFTEDYVYLEGVVSKYLVEKGVRLIGIDYVSVDAKVSPEKESHHAILDAGVIILETINLKSVAPGYYTLIALPIKAEDVEASLCRAVLLDD